MKRYVCKVLKMSRNLLEREEGESNLVGSGSSIWYSVEI